MPLAHVGRVWGFQLLYRSARHLQAIPDSRPRGHVPSLPEICLRPCAADRGRRRRWDYVGLGQALRSEFFAHPFWQKVEEAMGEFMRSKGAENVEELVQQA
eukprot:7709028-Pyramimonas_sp.AAC.1